MLFDRFYLEHDCNCYHSLQESLIEKLFLICWCSAYLVFLHASLIQNLVNEQYKACSFYLFDGWRSLSELSLSPSAPFQKMIHLQQHCAWPLGHDDTCALVPPSMLADPVSYSVLLLLDEGFFVARRQGLGQQIGLRERNKMGLGQQIGLRERNLLFHRRDGTAGLNRSYRKTFIRRITVVYLLFVSLTCWYSIG